MVSTKNTIPRRISFVNTITASNARKSTKLGVMNARANHAAEIFIDRPIRAFTNDW